MNQLRLLIPLLLLLSACGPSNGQRDFYREYAFTEADTLRGMLRPERTCYDVTFYDLNIRVNIAERSIGGYVEMQYKVKEDFKTLQVDLFENMKLERVVQDQTVLTFERKHDAVFITFPKQQKSGSKGSIRMYYSGNPQTASNPPWDGGFVWETDQNGDPWVGVACEGDGASLWWPNKDHLSDEPDSMSIRVSVQRALNCVANGNLRRIVDQGEYRRYEWFVSYPINNYNVTLNIAKYSR
ncbi:MAG: M1 family peptidase, partial [Saprospiraceae bacterium]